MLARDALHGRDHGKRLIVSDSIKRTRRPKTGAAKDAVRLCLGRIAMTVLEGAASVRHRLG